MDYQMTQEELRRRSEIASAYGLIQDWDVSQITDMSQLFLDLEKFNEPIGAWNVSKVTNMSHMFHGAKRFNQSIESWDTSGVTDMQHRGWPLLPPPAPRRARRPRAPRLSPTIVTGQAAHHSGQSPTKAMGSAKRSSMLMHRPNGQHHTAWRPSRQPPAPGGPPLPNPTFRQPAGHHPPWWPHFTDQTWSANLIPPASCWLPQQWPRTNAAAPSASTSAGGSTRARLPS